MLKEVREKMGVTIVELSRKSGVSRWMIYKIENKGYKNYKNVTLNKLANALGVDVKEIE